MMSPSYENVSKIVSPHRERDYRFGPECNTPLFLKLLLITIVAMGARDAFPIPLRSFIYVCTHSLLK